MIELGHKDEILEKEILSARFLKEITIHITGRPKTMPACPYPVPWGHKVICEYKVFGDSERMFICETLEDMQKLYDFYYTGRSLELHWYEHP